MAQRPRAGWSKSQLKAWQGTFTADNKFGARKLRHDLLSKGAEAVAREQCEREEKRLNAVERSAADNIRRAIKDAAVRQSRAHDPNAHLYEQMQQRLSDTAPGRALAGLVGRVQAVWVRALCEALGHKWPKEPFKKYEHTGGLIQRQLKENECGPQYEFRCSRAGCNGRKPY